jgi:uncharacterized delta-60 repeat protein
LGSHRLAATGSRHVPTALCSRSPVVLPYVRVSVSFARVVIRGLSGRTALLVACLLLAGTAVAQAAGGDLDTSYGQGGVALADFGHNAFGNALLVQGDGKVVVAGTAISLLGTTSDVAAARFGTNGTLDASFGQGGKSLLDFGHDETGYGAALQPDGKILVAGDIAGSGGASDVLVTRINADGTLDSLFGQAGKAQLNVGGADFMRGMALRPDGRIDLAGYEYDGTHYHPLLVQLNNTTGTLDTTFSSGGSLNYGTFEQTLAGIAITPDGTLAATGDYTVDREPAPRLRLRGRRRRPLRSRGSHRPRWKRQRHGGCRAA